jgi:glycosyltransferase involved in cell wall biosynthesis
MRFVFVSGMAGSPWGGSEELWSQTAKVLTQDSHEVLACVKGWSQTPLQVENLRNSDIIVIERYNTPGPLYRRVCQKYFNRLTRDHHSRSWKAILHFKPDLICISQGGNGCGLQWMKLCIESNIPYVTITQANSELFWPNDATHGLMKDGYVHSACNFFVSHDNKRILEMQIGSVLTNYDIVRNPFGVPFIPPALEWPSCHPFWRLACVGRLDPVSKGQDILIDALSTEPWISRPIKVSLYGSGPSAISLQALIEMRGLENIISIRPYCTDVKRIWADHHALVLPSRFEGLPLVVVEAMLCNRIPIVTDVAGNREIIDDNISGFIAKAPTTVHYREALERAWLRRHDWNDMGSVAGTAIRRLVPNNPARIFADKLIKLV